MASPILLVFILTSLHTPLYAYSLPFSLNLRIFLLGLGNFHGSTTLLTNPIAHANEENSKPLEPDFLSCKRELVKFGLRCCPPPEASKEIIDFKFPTKANSLRVRPAIHTATSDYISKFKMAIDLMKALPDDDPRSFISQANVHCTYCESYYNQVGFPNVGFEIHHSWLFFPFHRAYLYFVERIMSELLGDQSFAIPFWSWDSPVSMTIPPLFTDKESTLYDPHRDPRHLPPVFADFDYNFYYNTTGETPPDVTQDNQREINLAVMHRAMVSGAKTATLFMGMPYVGGQEAEPGAGLIEDTPHDAVHGWVGRNASLDMGEFSSAARDPVFYPHHANIDRLWSIWKSLPGGPVTKDFTDPAWLNSSFLFYNEKKELVRIKVRDTLDDERLGYRYEDTDKPWLKKPTIKIPVFKDSMKIRKLGEMEGEIVENVVFPIHLDSVKKVILPRHKKKKGNGEEVLVMEEIEVNKEVYVKFDVLINFEGDVNKYRADQREFVGSFITLAHKKRHGSNGRMKTSKRFGISELLEDLGADEDDHFQVTLVPRSENGNVLIGGVKIVIER